MILRLWRVLMAIMVKIFGIRPMIILQRAYSSLSILWRSTSRSVSVISASDRLEIDRIPTHLAFIMDGNRRWARQRSGTPHEGHLAGFQKLQEVLEWCFKLKIRIVTIYAFSLENFKRPRREVDALMELFRVKLGELCRERDLIRKHQVAVRVVGDLSLLPPATLKAARETMELTKDFKEFSLNICCPYTSRNEMLKAAHSLLSNSSSFSDGSNSTIFVEDINNCMDLPPLDLLIRTSGESRLSDFMLWQCTQDRCKMYFVDSLWPEFSRRQFESILRQYHHNTAKK